VLAIVPEALAEQAYSWLISGCDGCSGLDLCAVLVVGERAPGPNPLLARLEKWRACPVWPVESRDDVELAVRYTRPSIVLAWSAPSLSHVLPRGQQAVVVDAGRLGRFDALASQRIADGWANELASIAENVYAKN